MTIAMGALLVAGLSLCVSALSIYFFLSIPHNTSILGALGDVTGEIGRVTSEVAACKRDFRSLEADVDEAMEKASHRLQKARTAEANVKRRTGGPAGPASNADPLQAEFAIRQAALRDGTGGFQ